MKLELALDLLNITLKEYLELPMHVPLLCGNGDLVIGGKDLISFKSIIDYNENGDILELRRGSLSYLDLELDFRAPVVSNEPNCSRDGRNRPAITKPLVTSELSGAIEYVPKHYTPTDKVAKNSYLPTKSLFNRLAQLPEESLEFLLIVDEILNEMGKPNMNSNTTQTTVSNTVNALVDSNKASMITAAKLEVGNLAINLVTEQLLKILPPAASFILNDNPLFKVAVANLVQVLSTAIPVDDSRVGVVVDSMMTASYIELLNSFDLQGIVTDMLDKLPKSKLTTLTATT